MLAQARFFFVPRGIGPLSPPMPLLPIELSSSSGRVVRTRALLDTGANISVLPYQPGLQLGCIWERQTEALTIIGAVHSEARSLVLTARIAEFPEIELSFAWVQSDNVPLILGQINFFTPST